MARRLSPPVDELRPRLSSAMLVSAMIRRVQAAGGFAAVLHRGDAMAGAIIIDCVNRGQAELRIERATDARGDDGWRIVDTAEGVADEVSSIRLERRLKNDPDLWVIELDIAEAERFAAETIASA
jgi:hypothetical protein